MRHLNVALLVSALFLVGCSTYQVTISQGNVVQDDRLEQLSTGMSPVQVQYLLGTPLLRSELNPERWDYVLLVQRGGEVLNERRVSVFFSEGVVSRIEDSKKAVEPGDDVDDEGEA